MHARLTMTDCRTMLFVSIRRLQVHGEYGSMLVSTADTHVCRADQ